MKVVCESCQAKYQVPDERVAGKKLKIRCKRCGATVLIRGDLTQVGLTDSPQPGAGELAQAAPAAELEWHASIEGQSFGPFDTSALLRWLDEQPGGWDAHVWRDGFSDWVEVRACPELMAAAPAVAAVAESASPFRTDATGDGMEAPPETEEEEGPTRQFTNDDIGLQRRPKTLTGTQTADELRTRASSIRTRPTPAVSAAPAAAAVGSSWSSPAASSSPRVTASQAMTGERHEDSVLFSTANLQQVAMTTSHQPGYGQQANPGFASGEASGLIDIRALASLARQTTPQIAPGAAYDRFRADDDSRMAVMNQTGAFNRVDSLAPVSTPNTSSSAAVPLAILGGFALVAAAAFLAILITRDSKQPDAAVAVVPETPAATATAAQPTVTPEPAPAAPPAAAEPPAMEKVAEPALAEPESSDALANGKVGKRSRSARTSAEEKKGETVPAEKAKPKKEEKSAPPSIDEVMLAAKPSKPEKVEKEPEPKPEPKHEPAAAKQHSGNSDIDDLLGGTSKPTKTASKSRSIDDLLEGAVDEKKKGSAPAKEAKEVAAPAAAVAAHDDSDDLPPSPSRDEVLAAMRGVEPAVRQCAGPDAKGTAEVQITVAGGTGRVTNATVTGITGEIGSCIARAARNAKFPHFSKPTFQVKYPYRMQ
jgi:predicted Zn finger-like uncharacterized protein